MAGEAGGGEDAAAFGVDVDEDGVGFPGFHADFLLAEGDEEFFGEAPVEEGADVGDGGAFEAGALAGDGFGVAEGGDGAVFGVVVEEDVEFLAEEPGAGHFAAREEDFSEGSGIEVEACGFFPEDAQGVTFADFRHGGRVG